MHQIRYFLAVSRTLNFTQAAEECHVAQPSLTRAIKKLEEELGGELFRRERQRTHPTELGRMMVPLLQQCLEGAETAKSLAGAYRQGSYAPLRLALSQSVNLAALVEPLRELVRALPGLELDLARGTPPDVARLLESGEAELAIAGELESTWERLDHWPLWHEPLVLVVHRDHAWAGRKSVPLGELQGQRLLERPYCERHAELGRRLAEHGVESPRRHVLAGDDDVLALLEANEGVAILPLSARRPAGSSCIDLDGLGLDCATCLYDVAGRRRSVAADGLVKLLRSGARTPAEAAKAA